MSIHSSNVATLSLLNDDQSVGWRELTPCVQFAELPDDPATCAAHFRVEHREQGVVTAQLVVENRGNKPVRIARLRWGGPIGPGSKPALWFPPVLEPRVFATENLRGDFLFHGTTFGDRYVEPLSNATREYGWSEDHLFPGTFIAASHKPVGLWCAAATAERFHPIFRFQGGNERGQWRFEIDELPSGSSAVELAPGDSLHGELFHFELSSTSDPQQAGERYFETLRRRGAFNRHDSNPLPSQRIYCSWNYDFFSDITFDKIMSQAEVIRTHLPTVKFLQLDEGFQRQGRGGRRTQIEMAYGVDEPFDTERFPGGGKAIADAIRAAGLRPAIWLGLFARTNSDMIEQHPEWILRDESGRPIAWGKEDQGVGQTGVLDPSRAGVRDYLERLCTILFDQFGFEGLKLDFSSFAFESKRVRFAEGGTGLHWRRWLADMVRRHLPADGFFGWCVAAGTGDPLLAPQADYFRAAIDISRGRWANVLRIAAWMANTHMLMSRRPTLPNIDSIGYSEHLTPAQQQSWLNLAAVTGAALEVSGDLRRYSPSQLQTLNRTLELSDPQRRVWCPDLHQATAQRPPAIWIADGTDQLVGVFNWSEEPVEIDVSSVLAGPAYDAWSNRSIPRVERIALPPHASQLLRIDRKQAKTV